MRMEVPALPVLCQPLTLRTPGFLVLVVWVAQSRVPYLVLPVAAGASLAVLA